MGYDHNFIRPFCQTYSQGSEITVTKLLTLILHLIRTTEYGQVDIRTYLIRRYIRAGYLSPLTKRYLFQLIQTEYYLDTIFHFFFFFYRIGRIIFLTGNAYETCKHHHTC